MLGDLMIDENGIMDMSVITDIIGNNRQTIKNRMKTLIIKTMIFDNLIKQMCGDRIINSLNKELELEFSIKKKLNELYFNDENYLRNLKVSVFIKENIIWVFFYYEYSENENLFLFDKKIKL